MSELRRFDCVTLGGGNNYHTKGSDEGPFVYADEAEARIRDLEGRLVAIKPALSCGRHNILDNEVTLHVDDFQKILAAVSAPTFQCPGCAALESKLAAAIAKYEKLSTATGKWVCGKCGEVRGFQECPGCPPVGSEIHGKPEGENDEQPTS